jgi:hypothetical protein
MPARAEVREFLERFFGQGNQLALAAIDDPDAQSTARLRPWVDALRADPPRPTLLPRKLGPAQVDWYGVALSDRELRGLGEELRAFVGPTYAGFRGERAHLDPEHPVEAAVASFTGGRAFRISAPPTREAQGALWRALELMRTVRARRMERQMDAPRTTARVLYDFRMALAAGNGTEAEAHLRYLRDGHRLDALNLLFLRVQMLAELRRWPELLDLPELPTLLQVRRPFAVTQAMVGAVYQVELASRESLDAPRVAADHFAGSVYPRYAPLYAVRAGMRTVEALKSFMLVAVATTPPDPRLRDEILATRGVPEADRAFLARLGMLLPATEPPPEGDPLHAAIAAAMRGDLDAAFPLALSAPPSVARTRVLLLCVDQFQTLAAERAALTAALELSDEERANLFRVNRDRRVWERITGRSGGDTAVARVPGGWLEWLTLLNTGEADSEWLRDVARRGAAEWSIEALVDTPGGAASFAALLLDTRTDAGDVALRDSLPYLLASLQQDPGWPRPALEGSYQAILALVVMECRGGDAELNLFLDLAGALLSVGVDQTGYEELVRSGIELWGRFAAQRTVTWVLDLLDLLTAHPAADDEARLRLLVAVADRLRAPQIASRLGAEQLEFLRALCRDLGYLELYRDMVQVASPDEEPGADHDDPFARLAGRTVAVYTLTESVANRVREVLHERCGTVSVELCHDHVCTSRLRTLAENADIFLVATGSAKHAATECIEVNRGDGLPLLRPAGRGSASMLSELHAHLCSGGS